MDAQKAYRLIKEQFNNTYKTNVCREYEHTFVFPHGGANVICVDKDSEAISEATIYDLPKARWHSVYL